MLELSNFHIDKLGKYGRKSICKKCRSIKKDTHSKERKIFDRNVSNSIYRAIKNNRNGAAWEKIVKCNLYELRHHIEFLFDNNMTWENYGSYWWIDHIIPKSMYKYSNMNDELFNCWSLKNLRPLYKNDCIKKRNKINLELITEYKLFDILPIGAIHIDKNKHL